MAVSLEVLNDLKNELEIRGKPVRGYENYLIYNDGRVFNIPRMVFKALQSNGAYYRVALTNSEGTKNFYIHKLVAEHFVENSSNLPIVNHIDENPQNNKFNNLEWCTQQHNVNHGTGLKRRAEKRKSCCIAERDGVITHANSRIDMSKFIGCHKSDISAVITGRYKHKWGWVIRECDCT